MNNITFVMIGIYILAVILIVVVLNLLQNNKNKKIKKILNKLEVEKNVIDSTPIMPELSKIESFLKNEKLEQMYDEWKERLNIIKKDQIPKITDMLLEADYSLSQMDYKATMYKVAKLEMEIYKVRTNAEFLLGEIKEITTSEERNRAIITGLKTKYRELYQKFIKTQEEYGIIADSVSLQFENIAKRFEDFERVMESNDYTEVTKIIQAIDEMLKHMEIVVEEVPSIVLMAVDILPKKIADTSKIYDVMVASGYPLDYLNVEYNVDEANKKINDIMDRAKVLNLEDSLFELKVLVDYFDSLYGDFEKEKNVRRMYEDTNNAFKNKLDKMNLLISDIFSQMDDLKNAYSLSKDDIQRLTQVRTDLDTLNQDYNALQEHARSNSVAYSKLTQEIETFVKRLTEIQNGLDHSLNSIGSMKEDEIRARQQLEEIKLILKDSKSKLRDYNLPFVPNTYFVELQEAQDAIKEIVKELDKKPITIETLNTRVDTARDLVLKLFSTTKEMMKTAMFAEMAIVYGNRYRTSVEDLDKSLTYSEVLFYKGEYQKSLEISINALNRIEPGIYDKLLNFYAEEK